MQLALIGRIKWGNGLLHLEIIHRQGQTNLTFGILGLHRKVSSIRKGTDSNNKKSKVRKPNDKPRTRLSSFYNLGFWSQVKTLANRMCGAMHLNVRLAGVFGFDDPSLTGLAAAVIAATLWSSSTVNLNPDFSQEICDLQGSVQGWLIPLHIFIIIIWFLVKKPVRAIWWPMIKKRKKYKEAVQYA